jgi:tRNA modification GTPase
MLGIERSRELMARADLVLLVIDAELGPGAEDLALAQDVGNLLVVANKMDLVSGAPAWFAEQPWQDRAICPLSAKHGLGLSDLLAAVRRRVAGAGTPEPGALVPTLRQHTALGAAMGELDRLLQDLAAGLPYDILSVHLDTACALLGEITGEITSQEVLNAIFDGFCIGK